MPIIGLIAIIGGIAAIFYFRANRAIAETWGSVTAFLNRQGETLKIKLVVWGAPKLVITLLGAVAVHLTIFALATVVHGGGFTGFISAYPVVSGLTALCVITEVALALHQIICCIPEYVLDTNGEPRTYPKYIVNERGEPLDANNLPVPCERIPVNPADAMPHPLGGQKIVPLAGEPTYPDSVTDEFGVRLIVEGHHIRHPYAGQHADENANRRYPRYVHGPADLRPIDGNGDPIDSTFGEPLELGIAQENPLRGQPMLVPGSFSFGRFHPILALQLIVANLMLSGLGILYVGFHQEAAYGVKLALALVGSGEILIGTIVILVVGRMLAWAFRKSVDAVEATGTMGLSFIPESWQGAADNLRRRFAFNIFEQEADAAKFIRLTSAPYNVVRESMCLLAPFPYPVWAALTTAFAAIIEIRGQSYAESGGRMEVANNHRRLMRILYYVWTPIVLGKIGWEFLPYDYPWKVAIRNFAHGLNAFLLRVFDVLTSIFKVGGCRPVDPNIWFNLGTFIALVVLTLFILWFWNKLSSAKGLEKLSERKQAWIQGGLAVKAILAILVVIFFMVGSLRSVYANHEGLAEVCSPLSNDKPKKIATQAGKKPSEPIGTPVVQRSNAAMQTTPPPRRVRASTEAVGEDGLLPGFKKAFCINGNCRNVRGVCEVCSRPKGL